MMEIEEMSGDHHAGPIFPGNPSHICQNVVVRTKVVTQTTN